MEFEGYIFDLDGTLLESGDVWREIDEEFLGSRGLTLTEGYIKAVASLRLSDAAEFTVKEYALKEKAEDIARLWVSMAEKKYAEEVTLKPFANELLHKLKSEGKKLGIATTAHKNLYVPAMKRNGIYGLFDTIIDADTVNAGKDSPLIFLKAAQALGKKPCECAVFEDTLQGLRSAASCGFFTVAIMDKFNSGSFAEIEKTADMTAVDFEIFLK